MKKNFIHLLLLCALFFNIAHASIIAAEDECHHESVHEYVLEQSDTAECGDLCDMHHLFHFMAIIDTPIVAIESTFTRATLTHKATLYTPPFQQTNIKPPIA
jgi:hypothetical protein